MFLKYTIEIFKDKWKVNNIFIITIVKVKIYFFLTKNNKNISLNG